MKGSADLAGGPGSVTIKKDGAEVGTLTDGQVTTTNGGCE